MKFFRCRNCMEVKQFTGEKEPDQCGECDNRPAWVRVEIYRKLSDSVYPTSQWNSMGLHRKIAIQSAAHRSLMLDY